MTLLEAISARHSVRKYLDKEIPADIIAALQDKITECNKIGNLNIQLVQNETKAFTGMLSYGSFSGVKNYLVMVGKKAKDLDERVGYYGEQIVLYAQTLGLNTCWVGLSYRKVPEAYRKARLHDCTWLWRDTGCPSQDQERGGCQQCQRHHAFVVQEGC